jgi:CheY-like chemotaxis protein
MTSILLVEDDENDVLFLRHSFAKAGVEIPLQHVASGQEAIDYLAGAGTFTDRQKHPMPSLILLDLNLPHKTGFDVLQWIRATPDVSVTVVIVLTSSRAEADIARAYSLHANSYIVKPSKPQELVQFALLLRDYWLHWNQAPSPGSSGSRQGFAKRE